MLPWPFDGLSSCGQAQFLAPFVGEVAFDGGPLLLFDLLRSNPALVDGEVPVFAPERVASGVSI